jgi:hypothetical protein
MHLRIILVAVALAFSPHSGAAAPVSSGPLQAFYGQVTKVDLAAKTITLKLGSSLVFRITNETKISAPGGLVSLDKIRPGVGATVVSRPGPGNIGIAVTIKLALKATFTPEPTARTVRGETISGFAVSNLVVYQPPMDTFNRGLDFGTGSGLFLLSVRPDGSVANVRPLQSLGVNELDTRAEKLLMKTRFRPNSITEARIPVVLSRIRR